MKCSVDCDCGRHRAKGQKRDPAIGRKISASKMGHSVSAETRAKISKAFLGRKQAPEHIERRAESRRTHGHAGKTKSPEYRAWDAMKQRCLNPNAANYDDYGGRGITIYESWLQFENFLADMGTKPEPKRGYSLDRIDNDGDYEPGNVRWATWSEQIKNRPNFDPNKAKPCVSGCKCGKHA